MYLNRTIFTLYFCYIIFFIGAILIKLQGSITPLYIINVLFIITCLQVIGVQGFRLKFNSWMILFISILVLFLALWTTKQVYTFLMLLKVCLIYLILRNHPMTIKDFLSFINKTYAFYIIVSILIYIFIPDIFYELKEKNNNINELFGYQYKMLQSVEGSAATLDIYSLVVLFLNFHFNNSKQKKYIMSLCIIILVWTFRLTPVLALIAGIIAFLLVQGKNLAMLFLSSLSMVFIATLLLIQSNPIIMGVPLNSILYIATHARSMIWEQQIAIFNDYSVLDLILGNYSSEKFSVASYQLDGSEKPDFIDNPHNNYLLLLFRSPLLFVTYLLFLFKVLISNFDRRWFSVLTVILIGCLTNSQLISLSNPIYILTILYFITKSERNSGKLIHTSGI